MLRDACWFWKSYRPCNWWGQTIRRFHINSIQFYLDSAKSMSVVLWLLGQRNTSWMSLKDVIAVPWKLFSSIPLNLFWLIFSSCRVGGRSDGTTSKRFPSKYRRVSFFRPWNTHTRRYKYWKVKIGCHQVIILVVIIIIIIEIHVCFPSLNL